MFISLRIFETAKNNVLMSDNPKILEDKCSWNFGKI